MNHLTTGEFHRLTRNICPDCGAKDEFIARPQDDASKNIICAECHMRFSVGPSSGERIGKELRLGPIAIAEGTMSWSKHDGFECLNHSCGGNLELHKIDHEMSALLCGKCGMRQLFKDQRIINMDFSSYKTLEFFEYVRGNYPLTIGSPCVLKRMK